MLLLYTHPLQCHSAQHHPVVIRKPHVSEIDTLTFGKEQTGINAKGKHVTVSSPALKSQSSNLFRSSRDSHPLAFPLPLFDEEEIIHMKPFSFLLLCQYIVAHSGRHVDLCIVGNRKRTFPAGTKSIRMTVPSVCLMVLECD